MKSVINELWYGNIIPHEDSRDRSGEIKEITAGISQYYEELFKTVTDEQKPILEKLDACWGEYTSLEEAAIFTYAFKLGMQIAIETLTE